LMTAVASAKEPTASVVVIGKPGPAAAHPLRITAAVSDPAGVKWVRLRYRGVNQHFDYRTLPMHAPAGSDRYEATVPGEELSPRWDFMYFIEVMDENGNGKIWPDLEEQTPYVIVKLRR